MKCQINIEAFNESQGFWMEVTVKIPAGTIPADQNVILTRVMGCIAKLADASGLSKDELTAGSSVEQSQEPHWIVVKIGCPFTNPDFPGKVNDSLDSIVDINTVDEPRMN
jgi:hypothetical protein